MFLVVLVEGAVITLVDPTVVVKAMVDTTADGVVVLVARDVVIVVVVKLLVVVDVELSYCGDCLVSKDESFTVIFDKVSLILLADTPDSGDVCKFDGKLFWCGDVPYPWEVVYTDCVCVAGVDRAD